jgi:UDPglucose 6-dehydrogenase
VKKLGVIGLGKLGLCLAALFAKKFKVCGMDVSTQRIKQISTQENLFEPSLKEYLKKYKDNISFSTEYESLKDSDPVFIITQTPSMPSGKFDLQYVESALRKLHDVNKNCLAVVSSTINVGDSDKLKSVHEKIAYNPEFIKQGSVIHDFEDPKLVLIGAYTEEAGEEIASIWKEIHNKPIYVAKPVEAEIIKLSLNVSFVLGITFANIIGELCEKFNADPNRVLDTIYQDRRNYKPGLGFAGPCFPRDVGCFRATAKQENIESAYDFSNLLGELNQKTVEKYLNQIKELKKKKIGFLGVAYKSNVPYTYESQPLMIAQRLLKEGYEIYIYDVLAEESAREELKGPRVHFCSTLEECMKLSEVIFIGTPNFSNVKTTKHLVNPWK